MNAQGRRNANKKHARASMDAGEARDPRAGCPIARGRMFFVGVRTNARLRSKRGRGGKASTKSCLYKKMATIKSRFFFLGREHPSKLEHKFPGPAFVHTAACFRFFTRTITPTRHSASCLASPALCQHTRAGHKSIAGYGLCRFKKPAQQVRNKGVLI